MKQTLALERRLPAVSNKVASAAKLTSLRPKVPRSTITFAADDGRGGTARNQDAALNSAATSLPSTGTTAVVESPPPAQSKGQRVKSIVKSKAKLLAVLCSLDRGIAANPQEASEVDDHASELEALGGPVTLSWSATADSPGAPPTLEQLAGTWRLIYSSGFNTGSLGGRRPGPPAALVPSTLGQVYQRIDKDKLKLDNIVEFLFNYPLPSLPFPLGGAAAKELPMLRLTLGHSYEVSGSNTVTIVYEDTAARLTGMSFLNSLPSFQFPQLPDALQPPKQFRSASFAVTFLDSTMRVTRGDRGELRIYLRDEDPEGTPSSAAIADAEQEAD